VSLALGMMRYEPAVADLNYLITQTKYRPEVKEQIAVGLGIIGVKNLMPILTWLRKSRASYDLEAVTRALGTVGDRSVVPMITELATNQRATIFTRAAACQALGILGDPRPVPTLSIIREDHNYLGCITTVNEILARGF
jgi:HEAT repeat protein